MSKSGRASAEGAKYGERFAPSALHT